MAESHQHGEFDAVTDVVETIGGVPPQSLEAFIRQNQTVFGVRDGGGEFGASLTRWGGGGGGGGGGGVAETKRLRPEVKPDAVHRRPGTPSPSSTRDGASMSPEPSRW